MLMNLHAHLTKNEIIGFVGGQILVDSNTQKRSNYNIYVYLKYWEYNFGYMLIINHCL